MKLSLEEERARIEREKAAGKPAEPAVADEVAVDEDDEEAMMARAIAMSMETAADEGHAEGGSKHQ